MSGKWQGTRKFMKGTSFFVPLLDSNPEWDPDVQRYAEIKQWSCDLLDGINPDKKKKFSLILFIAIQAFEVARDWLRTYKCQVRGQLASCQEEGFSIENFNHDVQTYIETHAMDRVRHLNLIEDIIRRMSINLGTCLDLLLTGQEMELMQRFLFRCCHFACTLVIKTYDIELIPSTPMSYRDEVLNRQQYVCLST
ncbi:hypothetical protein Ciccas_005588 [Cichlidogyrus casuarinus]|uniref:Mitochondria-eating protein C-terminal domain-containing protein n=1 Tax=Cichlidogyrus casuarinus TaxID=1844966 RepID=A0ABD2Q882_9PLAT